MTELPAPTRRVTVVEVSNSEPSALLARGGVLGPAFLRYLPTQRWFGSKIGRAHV